MKFSPHNHRAGKLTAELVVELFNHYHQDGWSQGKCSRHYGITVGQVGRIVRQESWQQYTLGLAKSDEQIAHEVAREVVTNSALSTTPEELEASAALLLSKLKAEPHAEEPSTDPLEAMLDAQGDQISDFKARKAQERRSPNDEEDSSGTGIRPGLGEVSPGLQTGSAEGPAPATDPGQDVLAPGLDGGKPVEGKA